MPHRVARDSLVSAYPDNPTQNLIDIQDTALFIGATVTATHNLSISATDIVVGAAEEVHISTSNTGGDSSQGNHYLTTENGSSTVLGTTLSAGNNLALDATNNIVLQASDLSAGNNVDLTAGNEIRYLAAADTVWSSQTLHGEGAMNREVAASDEVSDQTIVGSSIQAGGSITSTSQNNQTIQAATLNAGGDITLTSVNGKIIFAAAVATDSESHTREDGDLLWQSTQGAGTVDQTLQQSEIIAAGNLALHAAQGITIEIKEINEQSVGQVIDAMVAENPELAWLKEAEQRGDVDWQQIKETHDAWAYDEQTLGEGAALGIVIVVSFFTAGAGGGIAASAMSTAATNLGMSAAVAGALGSTVAVAVSGAVIAGASTQVVIGTINNGGNLGEAISSLDTQESVGGLVVAGLTAGLTAGFVDPVFDNYADGAVITDTRLKITHGFNLNNLHDIGGFTLHAGGHAGGRAGRRAKRRARRQF